MPNTTPDPGVIYRNIESPFTEWRISWHPSHPMFAIERLRPSEGGYVDWRVVTNDTIGDDHNAAYKYAQELFVKCVNGEIASDH